ncbi:BMP family lipoprotein [Rubrimonas cliftonensis]|uniref:Basic membrane protein A n=1 Tax=Rubrimonas cliftonensis TaxID=89524 RepID=A0A1H4EUT6_9RHOB|nr:BMP family ABC transporter substrate-binding protein [Rubrimonas cliftonensis]SEA88696.1 basic membrane protein A [Rubrimonas cliftonensis]
MGALAGAGRAGVRALAAALALGAAAGPAAADGPAIVYSIGGKFDGSFNESAFAGVEAWRGETGGDVMEVEPGDVTQMEQALRRLARRGRYPVVAVGFLQASPLAKVAADFPETRFTIIDAAVDAPNVQSVVFREHEGAYVVGVLAAMASESGVVGVVGGMDIPLIRRFACGYAQGVKATTPGAEVLVNYAGSTPAAWADPARGAELARGQIDRGADVILQAAGGTGLGVLQAAAEAGVLGVGTDSNQNALHPGAVLTSLLKRTDRAVSAAFADWTPGLRSLGWAEGGLDWVIDEHNRALISPAMEAEATAAAEAIAQGLLEVRDSAADGTCAAP